MRHGCYKVLVKLFEICGTDNDPRNSVFNKVFFEMLTAKKVNDFTVKLEDINTA